ncbi:MAG: hypothetical protein RBR24_10340, partial [Candidatus Carbobacillus sp.]|nr:hypothetical protein [Candidatus Carbobacillus sp.]
KSLLREAALDALEGLMVNQEKALLMQDEERPMGKIEAEPPLDERSEGRRRSSSARVNKSRELLERSGLRVDDEDHPLRMRRYDSWREDEDDLLASLVLKHVAQGGTQLEAFSEAAGLLGRTASACGFRWNKALRARYEKELTDAKTRRREVRKKRRQSALHVERERKNEMLKLGSLWVLALELEKTVQRLKEEIRFMKEKQLEALDVNIYQ